VNQEEIPIDKLAHDYFDPGFSREEAEDWLNDVPLFEEEPRPKGEKSE
jgi:hypothetical protein